MPEIKKADERLGNVFLRQDGTVKQSIRTKQGNIVYSERYEYDKNGNRVFSEENNPLKKIRIGGEDSDYEIYEFDGFGNISTKVEIQR